MLEYLRHRSTPPADLLGIIGYVRAHWRMKLAARGAVTVLLIAVALFFAAAYGLQWARFSGASIITARVLLVLVLAASVFWFLVRPLRRKVTDEQVALYLEEHEPSLETMLVSAVESSREGREWESTALVRKLVERAVEHCQQADSARRVEQTPIRRYGAALSAVAVAAILAVLFGPAFFRSALSALLLVSRDVEAAAPYRIQVTPGNANVPKGADQSITATLVGFEAADATLMIRKNPTAAFESMPLVRDDTGVYEGLVFDVTTPIEYFVQAEGVQSPTYTLKVVDVPYAQRIELEYVFPAYTGLEPQKIEDGGDIAVLKGTEVRMRVFPTMKTPGGAVSLNDKQTIALGAPDADGALGAVFKADQDGFYHVDLTAPNGETIAASPKYTIDILTDQAPTVSFARPGRDTSASSIEEVFVEASAEDDFGVRDLELVYSVNGGPEKTVKLFGGGRRLPEVTAGHTFYMEELGVQPGDAVSYYARALDNSGAGQRATSDLYFLRIRPFKQEFKQAMSQGGGGGGGGGAQQQVDALSEQQRQIIAATFNVQRDRRTFTPQKLRENATVVGLSQSRLREQVEGLLTRMNSQLVQQDPAFAKIAELLPQAVTAMKEAEAQLSKVAPDQALPSEHKALQILQKAEEEYQTQISVQRGGGGGGGGGGSQQQQELADIFEQELDKMASRYETADRAQQESSDRQVDELLEKLKELARRQQQEAERQRRRALEQGGGGSSSGSSAAQQRELAQQVEEAARRLERLAREENRQDLAQAARQMQEAADAMRRAAAGGDGNAAAQAQRALERLQETERRLQRGQSDRAQRDIEDAKRQADDIARQQEEIAAGVRNLANAGARRGEEARRINERKDELEARLGQLESQLDSAARDASGQQKEASRKLAEAAGAIRNNRVRDKIRYSKALVSRGFSPDSLQANENDIAGGIEAMRNKLDEAQQALGQGGDGDKRADALDKARRLARGLESLQERTRERAEQGRQGQNDQQGQQGQRGQQGQSGQQGQEGQSGQQAGQGQQGQQGQQGGQGQQGQQGGQGQQGQGGGQGQQANGQTGEAGGQQANGGPGGGGQLNNNGFGYGYGGRYLGYNGRLTPEDIRQLQSEMRQWSQEAAQLRGMLRGENIDPRELDQLLRAFRQLEDERVYKDVAELARLQAFVAEGMKRFEFNLRRQMDAQDNTVVLTGTDEVPEEFRKLVEQYYRSLSKGGR